MIISTKVNELVSKLRREDPYLFQYSRRCQYTYLLEFRNCSQDFTYHRSLVCLGLVAWALKRQKITFIKVYRRLEEHGVELAIDCLHQLLLIGVEERREVVSKVCLSCSSAFNSEVITIPVQETEIQKFLPKKLTHKSSRAFAGGG